MNTNTQENTINLFNQNISLEDFNNIIISFRKKANLSGLSSAEILIYNLIRHLPSKRGFTPITNKVKISNGARVDEGFSNAYYYALKLANNDEFYKEFNINLSFKPILLNTLKNIN